MTTTHIGLGEVYACWVLGRFGLEGLRYWGFGNLKRPTTAWWVGAYGGFIVLELQWRKVLGLGVQDVRDVGGAAITDRSIPGTQGLMFQAHNSKLINLNPSWSLRKIA